MGADEGGPSRGNGFSTVALDDPEKVLALTLAVLEASREGILALDREGRIVAYNRAFQEIWRMPKDPLETSREAAVAFAMEKLEDPEEFRERADALLASRETAEDLLQLKSGRVLDRYSAPLLVDDELVGRIMSFRDVTESHRRRQELQAYAERLERSNRELEQFAYVASHDLREPLRMVRSYLNLLERRYHDALDDDAREFIDFAVDGATRMDNLIQALLAYSRVGTRGQEPVPTDARDAFDAACKNLEVAIAEADAEVTAGDLPTVLADPTQLVQLLQNLVANAVRYHREDVAPRIHVSAERTGAWWRFAVEDDGVGIPEEQQERIFEIFQRLEARKGPGEGDGGTGMGLAICKKIVERHGGRIWVESAPGTGSTFRFTLRAAPDAT